MEAAFAALSAALWAAFITFSAEAVAYAPAKLEALSALAAACSVAAAILMLPNSCSDFALLAASLASSTFLSMTSAFLLISAISAFLAAPSLIFSVASATSLATLSTFSCFSSFSFSSSTF